MKKTINVKQKKYQLTGNPSYSVKFRDDVTLKKGKDERVALLRNGTSLLHIPTHPLIEHLNKDWMTETSIDQLSEKMQSMSTTYYLCGKLFSLGLLQGRYSMGEKTLFLLIPSPDWNIWKESKPVHSQKLSPKAYLRRNGHSLMLEMPLSRSYCIIEDESCLHWLMEITQKGLSMPLIDSNQMAFYKALLIMGALMEDTEVHDIWEFHDLLFFHHSSLGFHDYPIGTTWRLQNKVTPEPIFKTTSNRTIQLPEPGDHIIEKMRAPFGEVLGKRRSARIPGKLPVTLEEIGALLHQSAHVQCIKNDPDLPIQVSFRPSPSGGALHSLEIYIFVRKCRGIETGVWRYDPKNHRLEYVAAERSLFSAYVEKNPHSQIQGLEPPHIRLVITSRFLRNAWKYEKIAYRLVLQDLGCLYQTICLVATAIGLSVCIVGTINAGHLGKIIKLETLREPVIGEMTISSS